MRHRLFQPVHFSRRGQVAVLSIVVTLIVLAVCLLLPVPFVKLSPGPTFNVIGTDDGQPVIAISGTTVYPTTGELDMTTVSELGGPRGGLTVFDALVSWFNPTTAVLPTRLLFPENMTAAQNKQRQDLMFSTSQSDAIAAALTFVGKPVSTRLVVTTVYGDSPSDGLLLPKDEIVSVDGVAMKEPKQVAEAIRAKPIGTTFDLVIRRDGVQQDGTLKDGVEQHVSVTSKASPDDPKRPYIGIGVGYYSTGGFPIDFTLQDVGGPSAGMMFALGIVDKLTPGDLAKGRHIAGTGTIAADGSVGAIGGIRQKLAGARRSGAELFLMPKVHCDEAAGHIPDGLTVVPIASLTDSVHAVEDWTAGKPVASCPAQHS